MTGDRTSTVAGPLSKADPALSPLGRNALNLPNLITLSRLLLACVLFVLIYINGYWIVAAFVFVLAASTDAIDGYIARRYGLVTTLGRILDPFVDKIIICGAFIFLLDKKVDLANGDRAWSGVNAWMVLIVMSREMFITSLRGFLEQHGRDFSASFSGKLKMIAQCVAVTASLLSLSPEISTPEFRLFRNVLLWGCVAITVYSGVDYVVRAYVMLRKEPLPPT
jgi:CDP-diacylglycerol--glycerol-3-phosphate 3-phosphatidyltransferase